MAAIDPASLALLGIGFATVLFLVVLALVGVVRRWSAERRWRATDDVVIDLTFLEVARERDREMAGRRDATLTSVSAPAGVVHPPS